MDNSVCTYTRYCEVCHSNMVWKAFPSYPSYMQTILDIANKSIRQEFCMDCCVSFCIVTSFSLKSRTTWLLCD